MNTRSLVRELVDAGGVEQQHAWGSFTDRTLEALEGVLPSQVDRTLETGCGKSTVFFSNISNSHLVFAYDDRDLENESSVLLYESHPFTRHDRVTLIPGPTQLTLPKFLEFEEYDIIMLDGPHGFPFVELEYYFTYPHLKKGGYLIIDDIHIPSIGQFADILKEDDMFEYHALVETTLVLRRTHVDTFDPLGDNWNDQHFNRRRLDPKDPSLGRFYLHDGGRLLPMSDIVANKLGMEDILATPVQSGSDQQKTVTAKHKPKSREEAPTLKEMLMQGFSFRIGKKRMTVSGKNVEKNLLRWKVKIVKIFSPN